MDKDIALLHEKVDQLTAQVEILADHAEIEQRRGRELDELKADLIPIGNQLIKLTINELAEIGTEFELEDLIYLLKRVLRNTQLILTMMDRFEALMGIADEMELLGKQVFSTTIEGLDRLEREGFFAIARESWGVLEKIVAEIDPADIRSIGEDLGSPSSIALLRELNQPEVRKGMARLLQIVKLMGGNKQGN
ncbi:MAG: hypothetical protein K8R16_07970 [Anaerolineales bacterium]|nr:hypothetical protein [Anaerolineales bacterium]